MNRSRRGIISSDGVMSSIAPTTCSRTYRTARVPWRRRVCESRTAPPATSRHENHARCCVWVSLCGADSSSGFWTVLRFAVTNENVFRLWSKLILKRIDQNATKRKTVCGRKHSFNTRGDTILGWSKWSKKSLGPAMPPVEMVRFQQSEAASDSAIPR